MSEKIYRPGHFVWRELMSTDVAKARAFYTELFGWTASVMATPGGEYTIFKNGEHQLGGLMGVPPGGPQVSFWQSYASVNDVDEAVRVAKSLGASVFLEPMTAPNIGRFSILADPTGAVFSVIRQENGDGAPAGQPAANSFCWESLNTTDAKAVLPFYTAVVGLQPKTQDGMSMLMAGDAPVADVGTPPPGMPAHWLTHVMVSSLEASRDRVPELGGKIVMPLIPVPGFGRIAIVQDPAGAYISLAQAGQ